MSIRKLILGCQWVEVIALAVWVGGLVTIIAAVIPAVFGSPVTIEAGGRLLTKTFHGYDRLVLVSAGALMLSMLTREVVAKDLISRPEWAVAGIMVMVAVGLTFYLNPEVVRLQELAFAERETEAKKAAYEAFFHYHWIARALYLINLGLGATLLCMKVWKWVR
ncbi:MAG: DUF4149 domain-containing protein [Nitrospirae bacterium]|nr:MAG: DUF4149 domain-containing protein [Nitrospirota bacterium]